jgi:uncharacterized membrane protein YesL
MDKFYIKKPNQLTLVFDKVVAPPSSQMCKVIVACIYMFYSSIYIANFFVTCPTYMQFAILYRKHAKEISLVCHLSSIRSSVNPS